MAYPQYPGAYDPYPQGHVSAPSGATAITAGVLAVLGCVASLIGGSVSLYFGLSEFGSELSDYDDTGLLGNDTYYTIVVATGAVGIIIAFLLGIGSVLLFNRKSSGRTLVVLGSAATVLSQIVSVGYVMSQLGSFGATGGGMVTSGTPGVIGVVFPIVTSILALVPPTSRWLAHRPSSVGGYPPSGFVPGGQPPGYGYPQAGYPQPGYPQQGYPQAAPVYPVAAPTPYPAADYTPAPVSQDGSWQRPQGW
ncbi:hypothetical protein [Nocardia bovistercoris]|uniref:DUF5336 domain-containing protein n=1 Tax=Nocardia bovistercoris TaxID=2785916 RepID=A0A931N4R8_9NOCA|nr:hypothetical protein [Nocardia bovistercoris]MBH0778987.1 hypothetical protein [Nocardia bovistercoris]